MYSQQHFFRAHALQQYAKSREKAVLPRFVTPPVFLCFWLLFSLLLLARVLASEAQATLDDALLRKLVDFEALGVPNE